MTLRSGRHGRPREPVKSSSPGMAFSQRRARRLASIVPLAGFVATWLLVAALSLSNVDVRAEVEAVGLVVLAAWPIAGFLLARRAGFPRAAVTATTVLAVLVPALAGWALYERHAMIVRAPQVVVDAPRQPAALWIDSDPACGLGAMVDVDDCWALAFALRSPELPVLGISTVFGNTPRRGAVSSAQRADLARRLVVLAGARVPVHAGADARGGGDAHATDASEAIAAALAGSRLTLVALGPATNIAAVLVRHPHLARRIDRIVMVGGVRPGRLLHPGRHWWFHFRDFNVAQDVDAVRIVLRAGVPLTLLPFDVAMRTKVTDADVDRLHSGDALARWIAGSSEGWLAFWQGGLIDRDGFSPFDALAVGYVALPQRFSCPPARARIGFSLFLAPFGLGRDLEVAQDIPGVPVRYCEAIDPGFTSLLLDRLRGGEAALPHDTAGSGRRAVVGMRRPLDHLTHALLESP